MFGCHRVWLLVVVSWTRDGTCMLLTPAKGPTAGPDRCLSLIRPSYIYFGLIKGGSHWIYHSFVEKWPSQQFLSLLLVEWLTLADCTWQNYFCVLQFIVLSRSVEVSAPLSVGAKLRFLGLLGFNGPEFRKSSPVVFFQLITFAFVCRFDHIVWVEDASLGYFGVRVTLIGAVKVDCYNFGVSGDCTVLTTFDSRCSFWLGLVLCMGLFLNH